MHWNRWGWSEGEAAKFPDVAPGPGGINMILEKEA